VKINRIWFAVVVLIVSTVAIALVSSRTERGGATAQPRFPRLEPLIHAPGLPVGPAQPGAPLPSPTPVVSDEGSLDNLHHIVGGQ